MSYKYGDTRVTMWDWKTIDEYISYKYNRLLRSAPHDISEIVDENGKPFAVYYMDGYYFFGEQYFVGHQHVDGVEGHCISVNRVYRLVGIAEGEPDPGTTYRPKNMLVFQDDQTGKTFKIKSGSVLIKPAELMRQQMSCGFEFPEYMNVGLPMHPDTIKKYDLSNGVYGKDNARDYIDAFVIGGVAFTAFFITHNFLLLIGLIFIGLVVTGMMRIPTIRSVDNEKAEAVKIWDEVYKSYCTRDKALEALACSCSAKEQKKKMDEMYAEQQRKGEEKKRIDDEWKEKQKGYDELFEWRLIENSGFANKGESLAEWKARNRIDGHVRFGTWAKLIAERDAEKTNQVLTEAG